MRKGSKLGPTVLIDIILQVQYCIKKVGSERNMCTCVKILILYRKPTKWRYCIINLFSLRICLHRVKMVVCALC